MDLEIEIPLGAWSESVAPFTKKSHYRAATKLLIHAAFVYLLSTKEGGLVCILDNMLAWTNQ